MSHALRRFSFVLGLFVAGAAGAPVVAQTDARLMSIVRLTQEGFGDSARTVVGRMLASTVRTDALYPEVLYTVGIVALSDADRRLALQQVAVDFPQSPWADDAMLHLAQLEYASDNPEGTVLYVTRLLANYPESPLIAHAALWGARAAFERRNPLLACQWAARGLDTSPVDVELQAQIRFQQQRCQGALAQSDTRTLPPPAAPPTTPPGPGFRVQVAAVTTQQAADVAVATLRDLGFAAVIVRDGGFLKIRAGAFPTRAEAQAAIPKIRERLGGQPFIVPDP